MIEFQSMKAIKFYYSKIYGRLYEQNIPTEETQVPNDSETES